MAQIDKTIEELKREAKIRKAEEKRKKKIGKLTKAKEKKILKRQAKKEKQAQKLAEKAGLDISEEDGVIETESMGEMSIEWTRKSTVPIEKVEHEVDTIFEARGEEIGKRWKEKYGDEPDIPQNLLRPKVNMVDLDRDSTSIPFTEDAPLQEEVVTKPAKKIKIPIIGKTILIGGKKKVAKKGVAAKGAAPAKKELGLLDLKKPTEGLWLYQKFGVGKPKILAIIVLLISLVLYIPMLPIRIIFFILFKIVGLVKKSPKKSKKIAES